MSIPHEELEVAQHIDQAVRTGVTAAAQLVEQAARRAAERDRQAAQALRDDAARGQVPAAPTPGQPLVRPAAPAAGQRPTPTERDVPRPESRQQDTARPRPTTGEVVAAAVSDVAANRDEAVREAAARTTEQQAAAPARPTTPPPAPVVLPAFRANHDRGVAPTKAAIPEEAQHRRQTWALAQKEWSANQPAGADTRQGWDQLPMAAKTGLYWKHYDTDPARTIAAAGTAAAERGVSPRKASTPEEREHRTEAWRIARESFVNDNPELTRREAMEEWNKLAWQDQALRYWTAYDDPASQPTQPEATRPEPQQQTERREPEAQREDEPTVQLYVDPDRDAELAELREQAAERDNAPERDQGPSPVLVAAEAAAVTTGVEAAEQVGHELGTTSRERVVQLNQAAADFFREHGGPDSKGGQYLAGRLGEDVTREGRFQLGYAPASWTGLTDHLRATQGATDRELLDAGLGRMSSRNNVIDTFRDRAMIGVRDLSGDTVGFVGRDLSGNDNAPRHLNTGSTPAFTKGEHLLGLHEAPTGAQLWRVEGPLDAIALTAAGDGKAAGVAPMGTALSRTQADLLTEHSGGKVWAALDNDQAGRNATEKDFDLLTARGVDVRAVDLIGKDPADMWQHTPDVLRATIDAADVWPSAGEVVVANMAERDRDRLGAGEADAIDRYQTQVRQVADRVPEADRAGVLSTADTALMGTAMPHPTRDQLDTARASEVDHSPGQAPLLAEPHPYQRTDHANLAAVNDPEAVTARTVAAAGFTRSTNDMLRAAEHQPNQTAKPAKEFTRHVSKGREDSRGM